MIGLAFVALWACIATGLAIYHRLEATDYRIKYESAQGTIEALLDGLGPGEVLRKTTLEGSTE